MKLCPCRYCEKRTMLCHSSCVDYIEWKKEYEKEKSGLCEGKKPDTRCKLCTLQ